MRGQTYRDSDTVDFVIVGSGAAGGVVARELAQAGLSVVVLEQGPQFQVADFTHDELRDCVLGGLTNDVVKNPQTFRHSADQKAELQKFKVALWYGRVVGGGSATPPTRALTRSTSSSAVGSAPSTAPALPTGPSRAADLRAVLHQVDWEIGVSGLAGADPFDPPRTKGYPMPPLPVKSSGVLFEQWRAQARVASGSVADGDQLQPTAAGRLRPLQVLSRLRLRGLAKASTVTTVIPEAVATGRCEVRAELRRSDHNQQAGARHRRGLLRSRQARTSSTGSCRCRVRQWSGDAEAPPDVRERRVSERPGELEWARRQVLMFNYTSRAIGVFEHELNEYKSVQVTHAS